MTNKAKRKPENRVVNRNVSITDLMFEYSKNIRSKVIYDNSILGTDKYISALYSLRYRCGIEVFYTILQENYLYSPEEIYKALELNGYKYNDVLQLWDYDEEYYKLKLQEQLNRKYGKQVKLFDEDSK